MKVCDVTEFYAETSGGVRTFLSAKARYLTEQRGWEHVLIVPGPHDEVERSGRASTYRFAGPAMRAFGPYHLLLDARKLHAALERERPDLIEVGSPFLAPWATRLALRGLEPRPAVVGFYHSDFPSTYARTLARSFGANPARWAESLAWRYARRIHAAFALTFAASPHAARRLVEHGIPRVRLVSLGVDLSLFHPDRRDPAFRRRLGLRDDQTLLLYVGRLAPEKGIRTLLAAYDRLPRDRYLLLVLGDGPLRSEVAEHARTRPTIRVQGHEDDRERLAAAYASADILVAPGRFETFGLAVVEAQACGLPVVAAGSGSLPELVGPGAGVLARADDAGDLAAAVERVSWSGLQEMKARARAHAESRFGWGQVLGALARAYEDVVRGREAPAA